MQCGAFSSPHSPQNSTKVLHTPPGRWPGLSPAALARAHRNRQGTLHLLVFVSPPRIAGPGLPSPGGPEGVLALGLPQEANGWVWGKAPSVERISAGKRLRGKQRAAQQPERMEAVVIGGGPAGLMAAESLSEQGIRVDLYDAMPSVGRKFLLAGKGGLNLTHTEPREAFLSRYGVGATLLQPMIDSFDPEALRAWALKLGVQTFVGSSGRVFPADMKAAPLLRNWLQRLRGNGVKLHVRHRFLGWNGAGELDFSTPQGLTSIPARAVVLALGGASWPRTGSDGAWVAPLTQRGLRVTPLKPANCGFDVAWGDFFRERFAGHPLKTVALSLGPRTQQGEFVITSTGVEGSLIYALSAALRDEIAEAGRALVHLDLVPGQSLTRLTTALAKPRGSQSMAKHLHRSGIEGVKAGLLRELLSPLEFNDPAQLASKIKHLPLALLAPRPLAEAISTAGGLDFQELEPNLMVRSCPGLFCAGEMLDWEAPTGGYLLTACFASGRTAGLGAAAWLKSVPA